MLEEKQSTKRPVQTQNEHKDLIMINQFVKSEKEQEVLKIVKDYFECHDCTEPIQSISFLHQEFLEKHENFTECCPKYLCSLNYEVNELFLLLSKLQLCFNTISSSTRILKVLTPNLT